MPEDLEARQFGNRFTRTTTTSSTSTSSSTTSPTTTSPTTTSLTTTSPTTFVQTPSSTPTVTSTTETAQALTSSLESSTLPSGQSTSAVSAGSSQTAPPTPGFANGASSTGLLSGATTLPDGTISQSEDAYSGSRLSGGAIAAAVVVPLLALLALIAALLFCLRRRKRQKADRSAAFVQSMSQKEAPSLAPVAASAPMSAYFANTHGASEPPPPPYASKGAPVAAAATTAATAPLIAAAATRNDDDDEATPLAAPRSSPFFGEDAPLAVPFIDLPTDRSDTQSSLSFRTANEIGMLDSSSRLSITSTAYSDTASLHSARAARMSSGIQMISTAGLSQDPFDDPTSPVSSVDGDESRALNSPDRAVSPINRRNI